MSVNWYMACHDCKTILHIAQDGASGFGFYSGEPECMKSLRRFLEDHTLDKRGHRFEFVMEQRREWEEYSELEWDGTVRPPYCEDDEL